VSLACLRYWRGRGVGPPWLRIGRRLVRYDLAECVHGFRNEQRDPMDNESGGSAVVDLFRGAMGQAGIVTQDRIVHRFHVEGDKPRTNGWYILHVDPYPIASFGAWNRDGNTRGGYRQRSE